MIRQSLGRESLMRLRTAQQTLLRSAAAGPGAQVVELAGRPGGGPQGT